MQPALEFLDSAYMLWDNTVNKAYRVKGEIQPLQNAAADGVRKDIANFGEEVCGGRIPDFFVTLGATRLWRGQDDLACCTLPPSS